ncbi:MAG TPA: serine hydrolase [Caulobacteraceae bacterium]
MKLFHVLAAATAILTATFAPAPEPVHPLAGAPKHVVIAPPPAPRELTEAIRALGEDFDGRAGIAVRDIDSGWTATYNASHLFPQQSVSKLWVALAVYDAIDRGEMSLDDTITLHRNDLSVFYQPIRAKVVRARDGYDASVEELLFDAIAKSDNAANDALTRRVGGRSVVQYAIDKRHLGGIRGGMEERLLQSKIAGMTWKSEYTVGWNFQFARAELPDDYRAAKLDAYLADPADGATPYAVVDALAALKRGKLLSASSTNHFLGVMAQTRTGNRRLRAGLKEGWEIAHKTGTGQEHLNRVTGWNDVGILTSPDGHSYAVAVMIAETTAPVGQRIALFRDAARAVVDYDAQAKAGLRTAQAEVEPAA